MTALRIATAQLPVAADPAANAEAILRAMRKAAAAGARVLHTPEAALSGYVEAQVKDWAAVDFAAVRAGLDRIRDAARRLRLWVLVGSAHPLTAPHRPHNSVYLVSDRGEVAGRYDKRFCSFRETRDWYTPGSEPLVFEVDGVRFGCTVCIEVKFPELYVDAAAQGVEVMLVSSYSREPMDTVLAQAHAAANTMWLAYAVPVDASTAAASRVFGPDGRELARARRGRAQVLVTEVDREDPRWEIALRRARPWRAEAREGSAYRAARVEDPRSRDRRAL